MHTYSEPSEKKSKLTEFKVIRSTSGKKDLYDIIVIGAGSGGLSVGLSMHQLGFDVLLVDKNDKAIGGECLNTGCVPSKALIHVSRQVHAAKKAANYGFQIQGEIDMIKVKNYVDEKREIIRKHENASYFEDLGIDVALGTARFISKDSIEVGNNIFTGRKIVIATGSRPRKLDVPGVEMVKYYDNESIFDLEYLPEKLLIVGGGPIGMELGQAFHRLGSKVTIIHNDELIMTKEDPEITKILMRKLEEEGMKFYLNAKIKKFNNANEAVIECDDKKDIILDCNAVLVGIGRELNFKELELENAEVEVEDGKIITDSYLRTTNKRIYLSGDVAGNLKFSHGAELHATLLVNNFLSPIRKKLSFETFPWVTFTDPEVATFGLSEKEIKEKGIKYEKRVMDFEEDDRAVVGDYQYGKLILFLEKSFFFPGNSKIIGGSMIAPHAGEITQELVLANAAGIKSSEIFNKIYAYPTSARVNKTIMINRYNEFLTPFIKKMLKFLYRL
jgi:pyruvate/2-oxoglutarate dehydrogenase complex dihydrolipoamide dehydrogenase (E3) component